MMTGLHIVGWWFGTLAAVVAVLWFIRRHNNIGPYGVEPTCPLQGSDAARDTLTGVYVRRPLCDRYGGTGIEEMVSELRDDLEAGRFVS